MNGTNVAITPSSTLSLSSFNMTSASSSYVKYNGTNTTSSAVLKSSSTQVTSTLISPTPIPSSSADVASFPPPSTSSGDFTQLFTMIFIACVSLALLFMFSLMMLIVCWSMKRRKRRSAQVTGGGNKRKARRSRGLGPSLKRASDGPLYAVTNLHGSRYKGIPAAQPKDSSASSRQTAEIDITECATANNVPGGVTAVDNPKVIYQRYLTPIDAVPERSSISSADEASYLQPVDGIPVADQATTRPSTTKVAPRPSPKPAATKLALKPQQKDSFSGPTHTAPDLDLNNALYDEVVPMRD